MFKKANPFYLLLLVVLMISACNKEPDENDDQIYIDDPKSSTISSHVKITVLDSLNAPLDSVSIHSASANPYHYHTDSNGYVLISSWFYYLISSYPDSVILYLNKDNLYDTCKAPFVPYDTVSNYVVTLR